MCAGTQYWANIGTLVYGMSERRLLDLTGNHAENPTLDLPCREVFARGHKRMRVIGPVAEAEEEIAAEGEGAEGEDGTKKKGWFKRLIG